VLGILFAGTAERGQPVWPRRVTVTLAVIVALVVGAIFGSVAATQSPSWVPAAVLVPQVGVLLGSLAQAG